MVSLKKIDKIYKNFNKIDIKYDYYHLVLINKDRINEQSKQALQKFSKYLTLEFGEIEDLVVYDVSDQELEIQQLTNLKFSEMFVVVVDDVPQVTYPLIGNDWTQIMSYSQMTDEDFEELKSQQSQNK